MRIGLWSGRRMLEEVAQRWRWIGVAVTMDWASVPRVIGRLFFFSGRGRHTRCLSDWSSDVCSSDLVYASDAGYPPEGPTDAMLSLYEGADVLIHDCTYSPEDRAQRLGRGFSSYVDAVDAAVRRSEERRVGKERRRRWSPDDGREEGA